MIEVALDVRAINKAIDQNCKGRGGGVYCSRQKYSGFARIMQARSIRGQLVVRCLDDAQWVYPLAVYKEW
ncbi:hypothetical protein [Dictyobacter kobayashii]|uniref:Uncharacterized protein n=1 Tax=Dictyobacter kobayashii TaxID=2014872 RepID=A0A402ADV7_9CHLR|nr:hypothetical protein [Dictyobacter kobayashii]GCE17285.1 hypothetical protein KDK_10850 [Dictyobacter kobayashii]